MRIVVAGEQAFERPCTLLADDAGDSLLTITATISALLGLLATPVLLVFLVAWIIGQF